MPLGGLRVAVVHSDRNDEIGEGGEEETRGSSIQRKLYWEGLTEVLCAELGAESVMHVTPSMVPPSNGTTDALTDGAVGANDPWELHKQEGAPGFIDAIMDRGECALEGIDSLAELAMMDDPKVDELVAWANQLKTAAHAIARQDPWENGYGVEQTGRACARVEIEQDAKDECTYSLLYIDPA
jgi:hypothetical protein